MKEFLSYYELESDKAEIKQTNIIYQRKRTLRVLYVKTQSVRWVKGGYHVDAQRNEDKGYRVKLICVASVGCMCGKPLHIF